MKIENIELLELFASTVCNTSTEPHPKPTKLLAEHTTTLAQQLNGHVSFLENLASRTEKGGELSLATTLRSLESAINDEILSTSTQPEHHPRFLPYVYPTV